MALTARQLREQRARTRRELEQSARKADRERLKQLRGRVRDARKHRTRRMQEVRQLCRKAKQRVRDWAKQKRAEARAQANAEIERVRARSRAQCESRKERARARSKDSLQRATRALEAEAKHQATMRLYDKPAKLTGPKRNGRRRRIEAIQESESDVLANIPPELVPVWNKVKSRIKGTARTTRAEMFLQWAHDHPGDVMTILEKQFEQDVARMAREEAKLRRESATPSRYKRMSEAELMRRYEAYRGAPEVPF